MKKKACLLLAVLTVLTAMFTGQPEKVQAASAKTDLSSAIVPAPINVTYTSHPVLPEPKVTLKGKTLTAGVDYNYFYKNNINPGRAEVSVVGCGDYYGSVKRWFWICYYDVPWTHSYKDAVYWATEGGIASGYTGSRKGYFGVSDSITRGQVVTMLWRAKGKPEPKNKYEQEFEDVPLDHSYFKAVQWAYESGITGGYTGDKKGYFGINDNCTRGQIVAFLWRYEGKPDPEGNTQKFTDVPVTHNFYKAIQWAVEQGITNGYKNGTFGVNKNCTRGHSVMFMCKDIAKG